MQKLDVNALVQDTSGFELVDENEVITSMSMDELREYTGVEAKEAKKLGLEGLRKYAIEWMNRHSFDPDEAAIAELQASMGL